MSEKSETEEPCEEKEMPSASSSSFLFPIHRQFSLRSLCFTIQQTVKTLWTSSPVMLLIFLLVYWVYGSLVALCLVLLSVIGLFYNVQDRLLYYPDQPPNSRIYVELPSAYKMPFENTFVHTKDRVKINLVLIRQPSGVASVAPTIVFFHGNAGNIGHRLLNMFGLYTTGCNILLVEYRGYGKSDGFPEEQGLYYDSEAALDYLLARKDINHQRIFVFGRSLGGAVAVHLASQPYYAEVIVGLILENTFTSLPDIGRIVFKIKIMKFIPEWVFKNKYLSKVLIQHVRTPTLFISGLADTLVPPKMMQELYNRSGSTMKCMQRFEAGTHNETWQCNGYFESINHFISKAIKNAHRQQNGPDSNTVQEI